MIYLESKEGKTYTGSPDITGPLEKMVQGIKVPQQIILQKNKKKKQIPILDGSMNPVMVDTDYYAYKGTFAVQGLPQYREGTFYYLPNVKNAGQVLNEDDWEIVGDETRQEEKAPEPTPEEIKAQKLKELKDKQAKELAELEKA